MIKGSEMGRAEKRALVRIGRSLNIGRPKGVRMRVALSLVAREMIRASYTIHGSSRTAPCFDVNEYTGRDARRLTEIGDGVAALYRRRFVRSMTGSRLKTGAA